MRILTFSVFAALLSAPAFAADPGTYRPGTPYSSIVSTGADVCDNQCAGDAQCRGWNFVKPNPKAAGICEFLSSVSAPISSQISISGENHAAAPYYTGLTAGQTNTVRVGAPVISAPVQVGQAPLARRVVRQAPPEQIKSQKASTRSIENMSLTAQQNRYRTGLASNSQTTRQPQGQTPAPSQRPMFRPILDAPSPQNRGPQMRAPQPRGQQARQPQAQQTTRRQASRRMTGPRRVQGQQPGYAAPQFQDPRYQNPGLQNPGAQFQGQGRPRPAQRPAQQPQSPARGSSRPPIGQPIPTAQTPALAQSQRPAQRLTPSQRLAQLAAQAPAPAAVRAPAGAIALNPQQARQSLFGKLNDDVPMPTSSAVPTQPVAEQPLGDVLAGGR